MTTDISTGEDQVRLRMADAGVGATAIEAFLASYRTLVSGATGWPGPQCSS